MVEYGHVQSKCTNIKTPQTKRTKQCSDCLSIRGDGQKFIVTEGKYS